MGELEMDGPRLGADARWEAAVRLARHAGQLALDYFQRAEVSGKPDDSMVTDADQTIEWWLTQEIFWHQARMPRCVGCAVALVAVAGTLINPSPPVMETLYRCPRCGRTLEERVVGDWD